MSHIVTIRTEVRDPAAVAAACRRLGLPEPVHGTAKLFEGEATGLLVRLPGWLYPAVVDTATGRVRYDNYNGRWGRQEHLDRFLQALRRREGPHRGPQARPLRRRAGPGRRLGQADHPGRRCVVSKVIEITVDPKGETTVQTKGFAGSECREASRFVEQALGQQDRRGAHGRVLPGPAGRPGAEAVHLSPPPRSAPSTPQFPVTVTTEEPSMTLAERLAEYVRACFTGLWVQSTSTRTPWPRSPACAAATAGPWPPGTSTGA